MKNKLIAIGSAVSAVALALGMATSVAAAQMTTSTLGTSIDSVNGTTMDYFQVLLAKYWPFVVGFIILVVVWRFGKRILGHFQ